MKCFSFQVIEVVPLGSEHVNWSGLVVFKTKAFPRTFWLIWCFTLLYQEGTKEVLGWSCVLLKQLDLVLCLSVFSRREAPILYIKPRKNLVIFVAHRHPGPLLPNHLPKFKWPRVTNIIQYIIKQFQQTMKFAFLVQSAKNLVSYYFWVQSHKEW